MEAVGCAVAEFFAVVLPLNTGAVRILHGTWSARMITRRVVVHVVIGTLLKGMKVGKNRVTP